MQFVQDHLTALIVGAALVLGLPFLALRAGESSRGASQAYAAREQLLAFVDVLNQDLSNVGAEVDPALPAVVEWTPGGPGATSAFEFRGAVGPTADATVERVRYTATPADSVTVAGRARRVPTYRVRRLVWDGAAHRPAGGAAATLTAFEVTLLRGGTPLGPTDDPDTADALDVWVEAAVGPGTRGGPPTARWRYRHALVNLGARGAPPTP